MKRISTWLLLVVLCSCAALAQVNPGELRFCVRADPKTMDPLMVSDEVSDTVRYLTGGVLVRVNRKTQQAEPELATSWKISPDGKSITFKLPLPLPSTSKRSPAQLPFLSRRRLQDWIGFSTRW
jgi:ABC-type transport system substrate-binding protein